MNHTKILSLSLLTITLILSGCSDKEKEKSLTEGGMKCGAGKCGSSMVDGSAVLVKKKVNILDQMKKDDKRRDCVLKAKTTKALYNCVRDPKTGRMTVNGNVHAAPSTAKKALKKEANSTMKCQAGKCSTGK